MNSSQYTQNNQTIPTDYNNRGESNNDLMSLSAEMNNEVISDVNDYGNFSTPDQQPSMAGVSGRYQGLSNTSLQDKMNTHGKLPAIVTLSGITL